MLGRVAEDMLGESAVVGPEEVLGPSTVETRIYITLHRSVQLVNVSVKTPWIIIKLSKVPT